MKDIRSWSMSSESWEKSMQHFRYVLCSAEYMIVYSIAVSLFVDISVEFDNYRIKSKSK